MVILLLVQARPAGAWESVDKVIHGSARVLEKGETVVGILSPLGYGVHERVTVFTHPALLLLLTPNIWARAVVLQKASGLSLEAGYQQSFLLLNQGGGDSSGSQTPGYAQVGGIFTQKFNRSLQITAALGYLVRFGEQTGNSSLMTSGLYYRGGAHYLIGENHLICGEIRGNWLPGGEYEVPTGTLFYAYQFGRARIGAGAVAGDFPLRTDFTGTGGDENPFHLHVYPWLDVWWRF